MLKLSSLAKTWIFDIDGTIVKHNGYKIDGYDTLLDGVSEFFEKLPKEDKVIFLTSRTHHELKNLKSFLDKINLRYDKILTDMPMGERILINDNKPSGLKCAYAINQQSSLTFGIKLFKITFCNCNFLFICF